LQSGNVVSPANRLVTLPEGIPKLTLGWEVVKWASTYLVHPNGPRAGKRWEFVESQIRFLLWWYAVDEDGNWLYHHAVRRLAKGSGKSPFAAVLALAEFTAPVRLHDFDPKAPGGCVGKPVDMPLVQIAATAESQTDNTMRMVRALASKGSKLVAAFNLDPGKTQYYKQPEGKLEVITSSSTAAEGAEASFVVADEALALDTVLPTPEGWTTVGEVKVGDRLLGSTGPVTVTHVTPVFTGRPCYRVTFEDGTSLVADEGHLWLSELCESAARPRVRTTREMAEDGRRFKVPKMAAFDGPDVESPIDPYVLGAWLGGGSSRWATITAGDEDAEFLLAEVRQRGVPGARLVKSGRGRAHTISLAGDQNGDLYTKDGSSVRGALVQLGVLGDKHIPARLLRASRRQRLDLLHGLMDTDGHIASNGSAVFVNSRKRLVDGVVELVRSLGYTARVTSRVDDRWEHRPVVYKVTFRPDTDTNPFLLPRKAAKVKSASPRRWKTIRSIEPVESVPVKCIEVDSDDHLFVAGDGWTLTHNTEHWKPSNGGPELAATLEDNLTKSGNRMLETCNAWKPGIGSVAQDSWEAWVAQEEGRTRGESKILYDARIAPPDTDLADPESLERALRFVYNDCFWQKIRPIMERIWDPRSRVDDVKRKYLNWPTAPEDSWVTEQEWAQLADPSQVVADGDEIVMFFDGSKSRDATALVGCRVSDGHVFVIGIWEPDPAHDTEDVVPTAHVDATVDQAFERWQVLAFFGDVKEWEGYVKTTWPQRYADRLLIHAVPSGRDPQPIAWDMRSHVREFTLACELVESEIKERAFTHDGDSRLQRHVTNARRNPNRWGVSIAKETPNSPYKIDAAVCMIGARMARNLLLSSETYKRRKSRRRGGRIYSFS
jgi:hypothetical protein